MNNYGFDSSPSDYGGIDYVKLYSTGVLEQSVDYLNDALYYRKPIPIHILHSNPFETYINRIRNHFSWTLIHISSIILYISVLIVNNSYYINNNIVYRISSVVITCLCYSVIMLDVFMKWRLGRVLHPSNHSNYISNSSRKHLFLSLFDCLMGFICFIELVYHACSVYGLKIELLSLHHHEDHYDRLYRSDIWWGLAVCRIYFLATASETTQQSFICLFKGVYSAFGMVFMQLSVIFIFSVMAVVLYGGGVEKHNLSSLYVASKSMFILSTTSSNPDLWLPLYAQNSANGIYFIVFLVISVLITNNIVAVSVYNGFVREMLLYMTRRRRRRLDSLVYSFQCLDIHGRSRLDGALVYALLKFLRPHYNDDKIQYLYDQIDPRNSGIITQKMYCNSILHVLNLSVRSIYMKSNEIHHIWVHNHSVDDDLPSVNDILCMCWVRVEPWCVCIYQLGLHCLHWWQIPSGEQCRSWFSLGNRNVYYGTGLNSSANDSIHGSSSSSNENGKALNETSPLIEIEMCPMPSPGQELDTYILEGNPNPNTTSPPHPKIVHSTGSSKIASGTPTNEWRRSYQQEGNRNIRNMRPGITDNSDSDQNPLHNHHNSVSASAVSTMNSDHSDQKAEQTYIVRGILITGLTVCICLVNLLYVSYVCVNAHTFLTIIDNTHKELFLHIATISSLLSGCSIVLFIFQTCMWYPWVKQIHPNDIYTNRDNTLLDAVTGYVVDIYHWLQYIFRSKWDVLSIFASAMTLMGMVLMHDCVDDITSTNAYNINAQAAMGIILLGRCLEILHIIRFIESLLGSFNSMLSVLPGFLMHLVCVLFTVMHIFTCIGLQIFPSMPEHLAFNLKHHLIATADVPLFYEYLHFNTYISGLLTLTNVLFVNNWNLVALIYENIYGKIGFLYFAIYYIIGVMFCLATITGYFVFAFVTVSKHPLGYENYPTYPPSGSGASASGVADSHSRRCTGSEPPSNRFMESVEEEYRSHREPYNQALNYDNDVIAHMGRENPYSNPHSRNNNPDTCLQSDTLNDPLDSDSYLPTTLSVQSTRDLKLLHINRQDQLGVVGNSRSGVGRVSPNSYEHLPTNTSGNTITSGLGLYQETPLSSNTPYRVSYRSQHVDMLDDGAEGFEFDYRL